MPSFANEPVKQFEDQSPPAAKEQPWKKWIGGKTDHGVDDPKPDVVCIAADGAQPINLGG